MIQVILFIVGIIVSSVVTWIITYFYYRQSSINVPKWAKEMVKHFPEQKPSSEELLRLFQENLDSGEVKVDPLLGRVACPQCGESSKNFERTGFGDDLHSVAIISCPSCGWSESVDVS